MTYTVAYNLIKSALCSMSQNASINHKAKRLAEVIARAEAKGEK